MNSTAYCPEAGETSCFYSDSRLPKNFCCPQDQTCISLDNGSSALCCPYGVDCQYIPPISCIVEAEVPENTGTTIFTTRLNDTLPQCDGQCCPFGYQCSGTSCMLVNANSATVTASTNGQPSQIPYSATHPAQSHSKTTLIIGVVVPLVCLAIISLGIFWFIRRRRHRHHQKLAQEESYRSSLQTMSTAYEPHWSEKPHLQLQIPSPTWLDKPELSYSALAQNENAIEPPIHGIAEAHQFDKPRLLGFGSKRRNDGVFELE